MSFARALFTVSSLTIVSRITGFVRDTLTAMFLGAGPMADAFFAAQRLPNLFRSLFAEGAFSAAFVPLYTAEKKKNGFEAAQQFAGQALALLFIIIIPFSLFVMAFMPAVIRHVLAPGFEESPEQFHLAVVFSLITFPYLILISVTALQGGVLNAQGKFAASAAAPISLNIVMIGAALAAGHYGLHIGFTLSWAFLASGLVQMLWLAVSCYRAGVSIPLSRPRMSPETIRFFKRIGPGALGAGAVQINMLLSTRFASSLDAGAVSWLNYADRLNQLPIGIVGIAVSTTLLPLLSHHVAAGAEDNARHYTSRAIEFCILLGMPATIGLMLLAQPIVQTLFEHGAFTHEDTIRTGEALVAYAGCIPSFLLVKVFVASFYARHDNKTPVALSLATTAIFAVCAYLLKDSWGHVGIAFANTLSSWADGAMLYFVLWHRKQRTTDDKLRKRLPRLFLCAAVMAGVTFGLRQTMAIWFDHAGLVMEVALLTFIIGLSGVVYAIMLQLTGAMRVQEVLATLRRRGSTQDLAKSGTDLTG